MKAPKDRISIRRNVIIKITKGDVVLWNGSGE